MDGIVIVNKPQGWTSFDVVAKIRSLTKIKKVGHSGTLDPMATGVLPIFLGSATKYVKLFLNGDKGYEGEMLLGVKTDTGDIEGETIFETQNFEPKLTKDKIEQVFKKYTGEIEQIPPMYSAVKVNGQRLYRLARKGIKVERQPRKVVIYSLKAIGEEFNNRLPFSVLCSKGTYIRQLVSDIGDDLGCGACLAKLTRFYSHPFHISQALDLETIITLIKIDKLSTILISPQEMISTLK